MLKTCAVVAFLAVLAPVLIGTTTSCGGGTTILIPGIFSPSFLPNEIRVDQMLPATLSDARQPTACCEGNTIYAVWEDYRNGESDILFNVSTDNGATWQASNTRLDTGTAPGSVRAVRPSICCDGSTVYVVWGETSGFSLTHYYCNRSLDGGATWLPNRVQIDTNVALISGSNPFACCEGNTVIVTWSDNRSGDEAVHVGRSTDAGLTWSDQQIGGVATFAARNPICCSEMVGMVHYVYVAWNDTRNGQTNVFFDRSVDGGATFGADTQLDSSVSFFVSDICCDAQYLYVAWLGGSGVNRRPRFRGSSNFGVAFNAEQDMKTLAGGFSSFPRLCCEGMNVFGVFSDTVNGATDVYVNSSADAGVTIGAQVRIDSDVAGSNSSDVPFVCCNGANLAAIWLDGRSGTTDVWASSSANSGATWAAETRLDLAGGAVSVFNYNVCCAGASVYALYTDARDGPNREQLQINRSMNSGVSWLANDVRVSQASPPGLNANSDSVMICALGSTLHAVWVDARIAEDRIFYNRSTNGGLTWMATDVILDPGMAGVEDRNPVICCNASGVYVAWSRHHDATSFDDVYVNRSVDGGLTWLPTGMRVNTGVAANTTNTGSPTLCCAGLNVYVAWDDDRNTVDRDLYFNRSSDGGGSWLAAAVRIDNQPAAFELFSPRMCCVGLRIHVVWQDLRDGNSDIYANYSLDGGLTWQPTDDRLDLGDAPGVSSSSGIHVCCDGTRVYVAWRDARNGDDDIYFNSSLDAGVTWLALDRRLDLGAVPGVGDSSSVTLCCNGDRVFAVWEDERAGDEDVHFNRSLDGGSTWMPTDVRLDIGDPPGDADSGSPKICCHGDRLYVVWDEERVADRGPYFTASLDAGVTWMPAPVRISANPRQQGGSEKIICDATQIIVAWVGCDGGPCDIFVNRTGP